ncbi:SDR family NAD(P)-dependent oxidoreductase [Kutzneria sp. NPDC052558]|uniref:SDR family NAD(P)-dependent oxidoreductase n=1 Tax=Kutzneria sp. NPDC052558 TaxID=3364121 RepID=UPI0037C9729B
MTDTLALLTGAYGGIGAETARGLVRRGVSVILTGRNEARLDQLALSIRTETPGAAVETLALDLSDLASVRRAAETVLSTGRPLDLLVNNAAIVGGRDRRLTKDGFELTVGTNHFGHFALTGLLLPALLKASSARVVTVSALVARMKSVTLADLNSEHRYRGGLRGAYATSKLANLVFAQELARRTAGTSLRSFAVHPGIAVTGLVGNDMPPAARWFGEHVFSLFVSTPAQGAAPTLYAAFTPDLPTGAFVGPSGPLGITGRPAPLPIPASATRPADAPTLWQTSQHQTQVHYPLPSNAG